MTAVDVARSCASIFPIRISNSQALAFPRRRASWLLSFSPLDIEGRRDAERRTLGQRPQLASRIAEKQRHTATPLSVPPRRSSSLGPLFEGTAGKPTARRSRRISRRHLHLAQPSRGRPHSGAGRDPKASRVCVCETQPRAPHRPSGCPSGQLSLCPTSVTPLEAPPRRTGHRQDKRGLGTGIRNPKI